jgi:hypothetical protein
MEVSWWVVARRCLLCVTELPGQNHIQILARGRCARPFPDPVGPGRRSRARLEWMGHREPVMRLAEVLMIPPHRLLAMRPSAFSRGRARGA